VRAAAEQGYLHADLVVTAASAWSLVHGLATLWLTGRMQERTRASDVHELTEAVTSLFVAGVMKRE
jgi:hypothetical protein